MMIVLTFDDYIYELGVKTNCQFFFNAEDIMVTLLTIEPTETTIIELEDKLYNVFYSYFVDGNLGTVWREKR